MVFVFVMVFIKNVPSKFKDRRRCYGESRKVSAENFDLVYWERPPARGDAPHRQLNEQCSVIFLSVS